MADSIRFTIPGLVPNKERHKHFFMWFPFLKLFYAQNLAQHPDKLRSAISRHIRIQGSTKNDQEKELIRSAALRYKRRDLHTGPVMIDIVAFYQIPKSAAAWKQEAMRQWYIRPTKKPDTDNIEKQIYDAMNEFIWKDDAQVIDCRTRLYYADEPRTVVEIKLYSQVSSFKAWKVIQERKS